MSRLFAYALLLVDRPRGADGYAAGEEVILRDGGVCDGGVIWVGCDAAIDRAGFRQRAKPEIKRVKKNGGDNEKEIIDAFGGASRHGSIKRVDLLGIAL